MDAAKSAGLFLDRDGIFNELVPWGDGLGAPRNWDEVRFFDSIQGIDKMRGLGFCLILITNQPDVERGITERKFVEELNAHYQDKFHLDAVYACFHADNNHPMKKPNPGMLLLAASELKLDLGRSFLLGDTEKDVGAARNAGCHSILWDRPYNRSLTADFRVTSLGDLTEVLIHQK